MTPDDDVLHSTGREGQPRWLWYMYGVQRAEGDLPEEIVGVGGAAVGQVEAQGLRAIVSKVRSGDFGQSALVGHLDDLEWLGTNAQAHEAVLGAALAAGPVLPLRFGTVSSDREAVGELLRRWSGGLADELDRMTGRREWGAKVLVDVAGCDRWIEERARSAGGTTGATADRAGEGHSYLARKQAERATRDERRGLLLEISGDVHERLSDCAVDACTDPPQRRQLSGHEGEMILNGAYLVDDAAVAGFHEVAGELTGRHSDKGVVVQTTGPWPPHHFISLPPLDDERGRW